MSKKESLEVIGIRIRSLRGFTSLSRRAFCEKYVFSEATFKSWETGLTSIRETSLKNLIQAFQKEGIICSKDWIRKGIGTSPYKLSEASQEPSQERGLLEEVDFFLQNNQNVVVCQMEDESMVPFYALNDYVGGFKINTKDLSQNSFNAIITLASGDKSVKRVTYDASSQTYIFSSANPLYQNTTVIREAQKIMEIAEIVWHRRGV